MIITRHSGINRFGKHERPVTIQDDDGVLYDAVLYFDKVPSVPNINAAAIAYVENLKSAGNSPYAETIPIVEVETILRARGIMELDENWEEWCTKPVEVNIILVREKN